MKKQDLEVLKLLLEGKTYKEIEEYGICSKRVSTVINKLKDSNSPCYNMALYNQIIFQRGLKEKVIDKDLIEEVTDLINEGHTFIEIAIILDMSVDEVKKVLENYMSKTSSFYDKEYYQELIGKAKKNSLVNKKVLFARLEQLEKEGYELEKVSHSNLVLSYLKMKKIKLLLFEYLNHDCQLTDEYLAHKYGYELRTLKGIFNFETDLIKDILGEDLSNKIKEVRNEKLKETVKINKKRNNDFIFPKRDKINRKIADNLYMYCDFWIQFICSFRLSLKDFAKVIGFDGDIEILKNIVFDISHETDKSTAIRYVFGNFTDSEERFYVANQFLAFLKKAYKENNQEKIDGLLAKIDDRSYYRIVKSGKTFLQLNEKEKDIIYRFKIKYAVDTRSFPFDSGAILRNCPEKYINQLKKINEYNMDTWTTMPKRMKK